MICVEHLTKRYGDFLAVQDLSFEIGEGHVYGFLGPNGAGKTTTMNIMAGYLSATEGTITIDGFDIFEESGEAKKRIGYLPEQPPLYMNETPKEYLRFVGEAKGLRGEELKRQIASVLEQTGADVVQGKRISALSKGYRQRVGIAQALLGNPKVIILDEPTVGLDPIQIIEIRNLIKELGQSHTVLFSSHILGEVQTICDQILMIAHGKLVAYDTPKNLERQLLHPNEIRLLAEADEAEALQILQAIPCIQGLHIERTPEGWTRAEVRADAESVQAASRAIFLAFAAAEKPLLEMALKQTSLEDVFLELSETEPPQEAIPAESEVAEG